MEINRYIHDQIFNHLIDKNKKDPNFLFRLRRSNRFDRLAKGFWFHGNEDYLALSFWSGSDWKNKTPNIFFQLNKNQTIQLIFSAKDSLEKSQFFRDKLFLNNNFYDAYQSKIRTTNSDDADSGTTISIMFDYSWDNGNLISIIDLLIQGFKSYIDKALLEWNAKGHSDLNNSMGQIDKDDFTFLVNKINNYRTKLKDNKLLEIPAGNKKKKIIAKSIDSDKNLKTVTDTLPISLRSIKVEKYKGLKNLSIKDISSNKQWIFITGENGAGKSSLLEAITIGLNGNKDSNLLLCENTFKINLDVYNNNEKIKNIVNQQTIIESESFKQLKELACYGPNRFDISSNSSNSNIDQAGKTYNLFHGNGKLLNIEEKMIEWDLKLSLYMEEKLRRVAENKIKEYDPNYHSGPVIYDKYIKYLHLYSTIKDILLGEDQGGGKLNKGFLPDVINFDVDSERKDTKFKYVIGDLEQNKLSFNQLSTGCKSLLAMAGDIICRFLSYDDDSIDPANFSGIVIIDEIDAHVHPAWQKEIPALLSEAFPKIQFIVTCHSPVPLLGFEDLSRVAVYKVFKNEEHMSEIIEVKIDLEKLTPNTILTSPIFDFKGTFSSAFKKENGFTAYEDYEDYVFDKVLKKKLAELDTFSKKK